MRTLLPMGKKTKLGPTRLGACRTRTLRMRVRRVRARNFCGAFERGGGHGDLSTRHLVCVY